MGQQCPIEIKQPWDPDQKKRLPIREALAPLLPDYAVRVAGTTSIDVTKKGIDKGYGIRQMVKYLNIPKEKMLFIGDKLNPGGNDYPVKAEGVDCIAVESPEDTKKIIRDILTQD